MRISIISALDLNKVPYLQGKVLKRKTLNSSSAHQAASPDPAIKAAKESGGK
jgi:hypothetical protein